MGPKIPKHTVSQGHTAKSAAKPAAKKPDTHKNVSNETKAKKPNLFGPNGAIVKKTAEMALGGPDIQTVWNCNNKGLCTEKQTGQKISIGALTHGTVVASDGGAHFKGGKPTGGYTMTQDLEASQAGSWATPTGGFGLTLDGKVYGGERDTSHVSYRIDRK